MIKVHYDKNTGEIMGFYDPKLRYKEIPEPNIEITDEQHEDFFKRGQSFQIKNKKLVYVDPVPDIDSLKQSKLQQINTWIAQGITGGFMSAATGAPHTYDSEDGDQKNLMIMLQAAQSADFTAHPVYQGKIPIRAIPAGQTEKVVLQHSAEQMQALVADMALHIGSCKQIAWQLQEAVSTAAAPEELGAIMWPV